MFSIYPSNRRTGSDRPQMHHLAISQPKSNDPHEESSSRQKTSSPFVSPVIQSISIIILCVLSLSRFYEPTYFGYFSKKDSAKEKAFNNMSGNLSDSNHVKSTAACMWGFWLIDSIMLTLHYSGASYFPITSIRLDKTLGVARRSNELDGRWVCRPFGSRPFG